jgi:hypothetical protein
MPGAVLDNDLVGTVGAGLVAEVGDPAEFTVRAEDEVANRGG